MEFLEGESLAERLKKGPLALEQMVKIGCEIADALDKAHRSGIIHRDLKPGNVMLTKSGAKLLDFGLAKRAMMTGAAASGTAPLLSAATTITSTSPQFSPLTQQGVLVGTVQYMSPEQIQGMEADLRSDIFALGAVLYEMVTGKRPFDGKSQIKVASAILEDEPAAVKTVSPNAPAVLDPLISRMLAKDPDQRWQCAADVRSALAMVAAPAAASAAETAPTPVQAARWKQATLWAAAAVFLIAALAVLLFRTSSAPQGRVVASITAPGDMAFDTSGDRGAPPAISADGTKLVYGAGGKLWLRELGQGNAHELPGTEGATFPFWSPDGKKHWRIPRGQASHDGASKRRACHSVRRT